VLFDDDSGVRIKSWAKHHHGKMQGGRGKR
jgi:hypothetical protein